MKRLGFAVFRDQGLKPSIFETADIERIAQLPAFKGRQWSSKPREVLLTSEPPGAALASGGEQPGSNSSGCFALAMAAKATGKIKIVITGRIWTRRGVAAIPRGTPL